MQDELLADGSKKISMSRQQFEEVQSLLRTFYQKTKSGAVVLAEASGLVVSGCGTLTEGARMLLSSLAAGNYAATNEMAKLLGENKGFKVSFLEGENNSLYVCGVNDSFFLVIVFGTNVTFGMVRVLVQKMVEQLRIICSQNQEGEVVEVKAQVESPAFQEELSSRLDAVLFGKANT